MTSAPWWTRAYRSRRCRSGPAQNQGDLATRKTRLSDTGSIGYVPGHAGHRNRQRFVLADVPEAPLTPTGYGELEAARRPMPREQPVSSTPTHTGNIVRFLDGHSEVHRERPDWSSSSTTRTWRNITMRSETKSRTATP